MPHGILSLSFQHWRPVSRRQRRTLHFAYVSGVGASVEVREAMFAPPPTPSTSTSAPSRADPSCPPLCLCFRRWHVRKGERKQCSLLLPPPPEASPHGPPCRGCLMLLVPNNTRFWLFNFFSAGSLYWKLIYPSLQQVMGQEKKEVRPLVCASTSSACLWRPWPLTQSHTHVMPQPLETS